MQLRADKDGFLIGDPIELKDLLKEVSTITAELAEIKELLRGRGQISIAKNSINDLSKGISSTIKGIKSREASNDGKFPKITAIKPLENPNSTRRTEKKDNTTAVGKTTTQKTIVTPTTENNKIDRVTDKLANKLERRNNSLSRQVHKPKTEKTGANDAPLRGRNGRFLKKDAQGNYIDSDSSSSDKDGIGTRIKNVGKNIVDGIGDVIGGNPDNSDPAVQAVGEIKNIFTPVGRGFSKIFSVGTGGVSRGQDRWYRRFFKQNADKNRVDDVAEKRHRTLLTGIYKKSGTTVKGGNHGIFATLLLSFLGLLATMLFKGFKNLMLPLILLGKLFSPLLKVLSTIAKALGLNRLFGSVGRDRLGSPVPTNAKNGKNTPVPAPNKNSKNPKGKTNPNVLNGGKADPKTAPKGGVRGLAKRIPYVGALLTAGFLANDLKNISNDGESSTREKRQQTGSAIGSSVGSIGGMVAGASVGAMVGSAVPIIGNIVGAVVGGIVGGIGGDFIGGIVGDKFGGWTDTLIESDLGGKLIYGWNVATETMSLIWSDFTEIASEKWDSITTGLSVTWDFVANYITGKWEAVTDAFTTTVGFIQKTWAGTTAVIGTTLGAINSRMKDLAKGIADNVKAYTGIDLPKHMNDLKSAIGGWVGDVKNAVKDTASSIKSGFSDIAGNLVPSYLLRKVEEAQASVEVDMFRESAGKVHDSVNIADATGLPLTSKRYKNKPLNSGVTNNSIPNMTNNQKQNYDMIMDMMMQEGFTRSQAIALTAEIGRENDFSDRYMYGTHTDDSNKATNIGLISWQGSRAIELQKRLAKKGLLDANGKMKKTPEAVREQIKYMRHEITTNKAYSDTKEAFMNNPNANPEDFAYTLGNNYIGWRWGEKYISRNSKELMHWEKHDSKRQGYKNYGLSRVGVAPTYAPNMLEGMEGMEDPDGLGGMQSPSLSDGLGQVKMAFAEMFKRANSGESIKHAEVRKRAVVPAINDLKNAKVEPAPAVKTPLSQNGSGTDSNASLDDVSREVSDHRIAHIVTGAYSKN